MGVMMATNRVTEISVTGRHLGLLQNLLPAMLLHGYKEGRGAMTDEKVLNKSHSEICLLFRWAVAYQEPVLVVVCELSLFYR
ncbi:hypothetical protein NC651_009109 [Populus alba x Populus x berolinensis]|nr:hypothetical protein NC651_009109 [Populus alba x Populus x berolinensis]